MAHCTPDSTCPKSDSKVFDGTPPDNSNTVFPTDECEDEPSSEGYIIITFNKSKKAKLKTAVFADVSDGRFDDEDFEDDLLFEDEEEEGGLDSPSDAQPVEFSQRAKLEGGYSDRNNNIDPSKATPEKYKLKEDGYVPCYGEALWIDENGVVEGMRPVPKGDDPVCLTGEQTGTNAATATSVNSSLGLVYTDARSSRLAALANAASALSPQELTVYDASCKQAVKYPTGFVRRYTRPNGETVYDYPYVMRRATNLASSTAFSRRLSKLKVYSSSSSPVDFPYDNAYSTAPESPGSTVCSGGAGSNGSLSRKMLRCDECGKYYRNEYSLHHHICLKRKDVWKKGDVPSELIDGQLVYYCPTCGKPFKWLGNLTRHFYVHTGQRFFKCDVCQKEFFSAYQVRRHMNSHTGMRYKCEVCNKPFTCKYACSWHTRQHYTYVE